MIHFSNHDHGELIMRAAGSRFTPVTMEVISRSEGGVLYGGAVYENYTGPGGSCIVHVAGFRKTWMNKDLLWVCYDYPFNQMDCTQMFCQVKSTNAESLALCRGTGWSEVITLEGVFPDADVVIMRMRREECRFLSLKPRNLMRPQRITENGQV